MTMAWKLTKTPSSYSAYISWFRIATVYYSYRNITISCTNYPIERPNSTGHVLLGGPKLSILFIKGELAKQAGDRINKFL